MPAGSESDCFIIVGVSRPKLAALFLSVMLISLFLTFHILYDSAVYSIQVSVCIPMVMTQKCSRLRLFEQCAVVQ